MPYILVLYDSRHGNVARMARCVARGVERTGGHAGVRAYRRPRLRDVRGGRSDPIPATGAALRNPRRSRTVRRARARKSDAIRKHVRGDEVSSSTPRRSCGCPGKLAGKPAAVFTSSSSMHGGQETTLVSMMLPLLHHGMVICGLPYSEPELMRTRSGGTPYGAVACRGLRTARGRSTTTRNDSASHSGIPTREARAATRSVRRAGIGTRLTVSVIADIRFPTSANGRGPAPDARVAIRVAPPANPTCLVLGYSATRLTRSSMSDPARTAR